MLKLEPDIVQPLLPLSKSPLVINSLPSCEKLPFETNSSLIICTFSTKPCALTLVAAEPLLNVKSPVKSSTTETLSIEKLLPPVLAQNLHKKSDYFVLVQYSYSITHHLIVLPLLYNSTLPV